jgi:uncharacterized protein (TIGR02996 family)
VGSGALNDLLAAVLADPDDFEARLVYGDYLTERDDPRGEFIHVQCALGRPLVNASGRSWTRPTFDGDPKLLEKRERKLLSLHQKTWVAPIRTTIRTWNWSRGFIERVVADASKFLAGALALFAEMPVTAVQLTAIKPPMLHTLAAQPTSAKLKNLDVNFQKLDADALSALHAATWRDLRYLDLSGNKFGIAGARVLAKASLPALRVLRFNDAELTDEMLATLAESPFLPALETLDLAYNPAVTYASARPLIAAAPALVKLRLRRTAVTDAELDKIKAARPALEIYD